MHTEVLLAVADAPGTSMTLVGAMVIAITTLAGVSVFLFTRYDKRNDQIATEREKIAEERHASQMEREKLMNEHRAYVSQLKADHLEAERKTSEKFATHLAEIHRQCRENETLMRRETADMIESMAAEQSKAIASNVLTMEKLIERIVSTPHRAGR